MSDHVQFAKQFGSLIVKEDYLAARALLTREAQIDWPAQEIQRRSERMRRYAPGPFTDMQVTEEFILQDWPAKREHDVASIYIALTGDGFSEAATIIVAQQDGELRIRDLEWGRP